MKRLPVETITLEESIRQHETYRSIVCRSRRSENGSVEQVYVLP
jgi:hypothetical protein